MMLLGASQRSSKRAVLSSGGLQYKRRITFLPYSYRYGLTRIIRYQRKGLPENPFQLLFSRPRCDEDSPQQLKVWGRKWEYEERNGVVKERTREFVPGKGWVDIDPAYSEIESQKGQSNNKEPSEEFEIDLITLQRVPKEKAAQQPPQKPDTSQEKTKLPSGEGRNKVESASDSNSSKPPIEQLPVDEENSETPSSSTSRKQAKKANKSSQKSSSTIAEATPDEPPHVPPKAGTEGDKETLVVDITSKSTPTSSMAAAEVTQEVSLDGLPTEPPEPLGTTSKKALPKETLQNNSEERSPQDVKPEKKTKLVSPKDKATSELKDRRGILDEVLSNQKQALEKMTPPSLSPKPTKSSEIAVKDVLGALDGNIAAFQAAGVTEPLSTPDEVGKNESNLDRITLSNAPSKAVRKSTSPSPKSTEPFSTRASDLPVSVKTRNTSADSVGTKGGVLVVEGISQPVPPAPTEQIGGGESAIAKSPASSSTQLLKKRVSPAPSVPAKPSVQGSGVVTSDTATPQWAPLKPVEPILRSASSVVTKGQATGAPVVLDKSVSPRSPSPVEPSNAIADAAVLAADSTSSTRPSSEARKGGQVPSFFTNDSVTGILEEVRGATAPLAPGSSAKEKFKYHRLNIANRPGEDLGSPDADVDILLPSDIRAAAGAPGKTVTRIESAAERQQRRAKMIEEFEVSYERENSEIIEIQKGMRGKASQTSETASAGRTVEEAHSVPSSTRSDGGAASKPKNSEKLLKAGGVRSSEEHEDYLWSGTENVSAEDVLGVAESTNPPQNSTSAPDFATQQTAFEIDGGLSQTTSSPALFKFFALVRNPENGEIQFTTLPRAIVSDAMTRESTAFDSLQNLDSPDSFLPLWRVLQKGGFTVVGGEKDCLVVKVEAEAARAKQELVLKEIKVKLSPAELVARESWERKRRIGKFGIEKEPDKTEDVSTVEDVAATIKSQPQLQPTAPQAKIPPTTMRPRPESESKLEATYQKVEEAIKEKGKSTEQIPEVQANQPRKDRPFRRVFWTAVWVAACSGAVSVGLEGYI